MPLFDQLSADNELCRPNNSTTLTFLNNKKPKNTGIRACKAFMQHFAANGTYYRRLIILIALASFRPSNNHRALLKYSTLFIRSLNSHFPLTSRDSLDALPDNYCENDPKRICGT